MSVFHHKPGSIHYPRMERQDLTQGQLGSFKFIPTDTVTYDMPTFPSLEQQWLYTSVQPGAIDTSIVAPATENQHPMGTSHHNFYSHDTAATEDTSGSRIASNNNSSSFRPLAMGNHVRTGSHSPYKRFPPINEESYRRRRDSTRVSARAYGPYHLRDNSDATISAVDHAATASETGNTETENFQSSLLRALASEQDAHNWTKVELRKLRIRCGEVEARLESTESQNRSLLGTVAMLKSLVQHSVKKEQDREQESLTSRQREGPLHSLRQIVGQDANLSIADGSDTIRKGNAEKHGAQQHNGLNSGVADLAIWDFDSFEHAYLKGEIPSHAIAALLDPKKEFKLDRLIDISPEKPKQTFLPSKFDETSVQQQNPINDGLSRKQRSSHDAMSIQSAQDISEPHSGTLSHNGARVHSIGTTSLSTDPPTVTTPDYLDMSYDVNIKWNVTDLNPIFENDAEKYNHLGPAYKVEFKDSYFYEYPVRYTPSKGEKNLYRTVMVDFLPVDTDFFMLLDLIRGGSVESIQLFDPLPRCTEFRTARVVFNYELGARTMYMRGQSPGLYVNGLRVRVWQVLQPTYLKNKKLEFDVFEKGCTRLLIMDNASEQAVMMLPEKLHGFIRLNLLIEIARTHDGLPIVEFTSVAAAIDAMNQLIHDSDYAGVTFDFEADQCEEPYED